MKILSKLFKKTAKKNRQIMNALQDKITLSFEMPKEQAKDFVVEIQQTKHFAVRLTEKEIKKVTDAIMHNKSHEVILEYGA